MKHLSTKSLLASVSVLTVICATGAFGETKLTASDAAAGDEFGYSVALSGDKALVGTWDRTEDINPGRVYLYDISDPDNVEDPYILTETGMPGQYFGRSVAVSGDRALVGADAYWDEDDEASVYKSGGAYLYDVSDPDHPELIEILTASDTRLRGEFGFSVALSASGNTALVGAPGGGDDRLGAAYLFNISDLDNITETDILTPSNGGRYADFGSSVALSDDTALVGARWHDDYTGAVYLYDISELDDPGYTGTLLMASDGTERDLFGWSIAVSGTAALVGAKGYGPDNENGVSPGAAYLFNISDPENPVERGRLMASEGASSGAFGISVALSGTTALVGAYQHDYVAEDAGAAFVFNISPDHDPEETRILTASDAAAGDEFGHSVALSRNTALVGARRDNHDNDETGGANSGSAYVYDQVVTISLMPQPLCRAFAWESLYIFSHAAPALGSRGPTEGDAAQAQGTGPGTNAGTALVRLDHAMAIYDRLGCEKAALQGAFDCVLNLHEGKVTQEGLQGCLAEQGFAAK